MALSIFDDKSKAPTDTDLAAALKRSYVLWNNLRNLISERFTPVTCDWGFASKTTGWGMRLKHKDRAILYMTPCAGYFLASFALGEKAVKLAHEARLPTSVLNVIDNAKKYAEGRGVRLEVRTARDVSNVERIAVIKMSK